MTIPLISLMCYFADNVSYWLFADSKYIGAVYLLAVSTIFLIFERFILLFIRMENKALSFSLYNILIKFMILVVTIVFLLIFKPVFITVVYSTILGQMIGDLILLLTHLRLFKKQAFVLDRGLVKRLARFGLPVVVATFIYSLFVVIDKVFLRYYADFTQLGLYTAAFKIASALLILQISFSNFWVPTAYEWYQKKKPVRYYELVSHIMMLLISILFIFLLLAKGLIIYILSPEYEEAKYIFPFLCFYPLMMTMSETTNLGIVFLRKSYLNIIVSCFALLVSLILNFWLVPLYGSIGAAIATGTAYIAFFIARTVISMRIWEGFSVRKHMLVTVILYVLALYNTFGPDNGFQYAAALIALAAILGLYHKLLLEAWQRINVQSLKKAITNKGIK